MDERVRGSGWNRVAAAAGAVLLAALVLMLGGCTSLRVWMGSRVRLEKVPVERMEAWLPQGPAMYPGQTTPLVVAVTDTAGKILLTEGAGNGKVLWDDLVVTPALMAANRKGMVTMPADPRVTDTAFPSLTVTAPSHPWIFTKLDVFLRYDHDFAANFSGRNGRSGMDGSNGIDGTSGMSGSTDLENPSPGGDGSDGTDGGDGDDGGAGEDAGPVRVLLTLRSGGNPLLQAEVSGKGRDEYFLVDPVGGSLTVKAEGGSGGAGGRGGRGGRGGSGGSGWPSGSSGRDGRDGRDGFPGAPGKGGRITVVYDPAARPYLSLLTLSSRDGNGRKGPDPVFTEQAVPPLW
ncbi:hypothetical protein L4X63_01085 [Geomonas sp. Red32]|uniref:hypothetical protein n=1 Tax=Geomonas sp. Red32 TaxID=2912856 RepID=UPI00202CA8C9|nr:hypothetical protein [Geomonas sp. Red32]MCM0080175.1 hypothetical protein [Geomonas sp. Red32]